MNEAYRNRYRVVRRSWRSAWCWGIQTGTGTRLCGYFVTKMGALRMAAELLTAFNDGMFTIYDNKSSSK